MFSKGQKVVCINDQFPGWVAEFFDQLPVKGRTYTVRAVCLRRETLKGSEEATIALLLEELRNLEDPTHKDKQELAFKAERFAPLETVEETKEAEIADAIGIQI